MRCRQLLRAPDVAAQIRSNRYETGSDGRKPVKQMSKHHGRVVEHLQNAESLTTR